MNSRHQRPRRAPLGGWLWLVAAGWLLASGLAAQPAGEDSGLRETLRRISGQPQPAVAEEWGRFRGDAERGRLVFASCRTCHYPEKEVGHHNGPNLHGIFGREAGSHRDYDGYSGALLAADFAWTPERLDRWLQDPAFIDNTTMMFLAIEDAQERADLIAYLQQFREGQIPAVP